MEGRITTPFGAPTPAREVLVGIDLQGKRAIVTGASSGISLETACALAQAGSTSRGVSVKTIEQGAATSVLLAASPLVEGLTGCYFEDCQEAGPHQPRIRRGVAAYAIL